MRLLISIFAVLTISTVANAAEPVVALSPEAQRSLLASDDPQLAANKKLVWDMWRNFLQANNVDAADTYLAEEYHQHNPNAETGLAGAGGCGGASGRLGPGPGRDPLWLLPCLRQGGSSPCGGHSTRG